MKSLYRNFVHHSHRVLNTHHYKHPGLGHGPSEVDDHHLMIGHRSANVSRKKI